MFFVQPACGAAVGGACQGPIDLVIEAGLTAASGAVGAAVLKASGYDGYHPGQAAAMGAVGGAILGFIYGCLSGCSVGFFRGCVVSWSSDEKKGQAAGNSALSLFAWGVNIGIAIGLKVLSEMLGYAILMHLSAIDMEFGKTVASAAVGGAILVPGIALVNTLLACCCLGFFGCGALACLGLTATVSEAVPSLELSQV